MIDLSFYTTHTIIELNICILDIKSMWYNLPIDYSLYDPHVVFNTVNQQVLTNQGLDMTGFPNCTFFEVYVFECVMRRLQTMIFNQGAININYQEQLRSPEIQTLLLIAPNLLSNPISNWKEIPGYQAVFQKEFSYQTIISTIRRIFFLFTLYAINTYPDRYDNLDNSFFVMAELLALYGDFQTDVVHAFEFYTKFMGQVPPEYIRHNYSSIHKSELRHVYLHDNDLPHQVLAHVPEHILALVLPDGGGHIAGGFPLNRVLGGVMADNQNVHATPITEQTKSFLHILWYKMDFSQNPKIPNPMEFYKTLYVERYIKPEPLVLNKPNWFDKLKNFFHKTTKAISSKPQITSAIRNALYRIQTDKTPCALISNEVHLSHIFEKIVYFILYKVPKELQNDVWLRVDQELTEMNGMCFVGHLNRLLNALSGFDPFGTVQNESMIEKEVYDYLMFIVNKNIESEPEELRDELVNGFGDPDKLRLFETFIEKHYDEWFTSINKKYNNVSSSILYKSIDKALIKMQMKKEKEE